MALMPRKRVMVFAFGVAVSAAAVAYWRSTNKSRNFTPVAGDAATVTPTRPAPHPESPSSWEPIAPIAADLVAADGSPVVVVQAVTFSDRSEEVPAHGDSALEERTNASDLGAGDAFAAIASDAGAISEPYQEPADAEADETAADEEPVAASYWSDSREFAPAANLDGLHETVMDRDDEEPEPEASPDADDAELTTTLDADGAPVAASFDTTDGVVVARVEADAPVARRAETEDALAAASRYAREIVAAHAAAEAATKLDLAEAATAETLATDDGAAVEVVITSGPLADVPQTDGDDHTEVTIESTFVWDEPVTLIATPPTPADTAEPLDTEHVTATRDRDWPAQRSATTPSPWT